MAGFFVRLVVIDDGGPKGQGSSRSARRAPATCCSPAPSRSTKPGKKGEPVKPKFLGGRKSWRSRRCRRTSRSRILKGKAELPKPAFSRKEKLAEWVTAAENPYFARAVANRVWGQFMGRGLVHPVDDLGSEQNEPSHPELLQAMTEGIVAHKFDLKWLIREIVNSEAYQLGDSGPRQGCDAGDVSSVPRVRPLSAEELMPSLRVATGLRSRRGHEEHAAITASTSCATSASRPTARATSRAASPSTCSSTTRR